jgi:predicted GNAT family N-acyltransferase
MSVQLQYGLFVCLSDADVRSRWQAIGASALSPERLGRAAAVQGEECSLEEAEARLKAWLDAAPTRAGIVFSDQLVETGGMTAAAKELFDAFGARLYASIATMRRRRRVLDIDRVLGWRFTEERLLRVLRLCLDRLAYLAPPAAIQLNKRPVIRPLVTETELCNYFKLRHQVYTPMAYLDEVIEESPLEMDIDWFDTQSIHLGAFTETEQLIGTARVIMSEPVNEAHRDMTRSLASRDPILEDRVINGATLASLPVFQLENRQFDASVLRALGAMVAQNQRFAELSRVIVHPDFRGAGLSLDLVHAALQTARQHDVFEIFLECLPIHERLYRKAGFLPVAGAVGTVYGVGKTMIVMHQPLKGSIVTTAAPDVINAAALKPPHMTRKRRKVSREQS